MTLIMVIIDGEKKSSYKVLLEADAGTTNIAVQIIDVQSREVFFYLPEKNVFKCQ